ncbi:hypothetical protein [Streptomyces sp. ISL-94]|uniref:hypothetical protein n=1 Tax=Streptomyces sp. ISL-94 TaxID=2819190 RepID=UPI001BE8B3BE|nr:hypothetical protein [Streptomyces sp. ISL-94]MBT2482257.1 hypothetical protein [Streptomyces sp. ISL-94]
MPRRSPAQVRQNLPSRVRPGHGPRAPRIPGLSGPALAAIARIERRPSWPGPVSEAWRRWRALAHQPGPWVMYAADEHCVCCDPFAGADVRAVLEAACAALPRRPAAELRALLAPLDARFLARTLNDPFAAPGDPWWSRRLTSA